MICEINGCGKEIIKGRFLCTKVMARNKEGVKPINLFVVACEDCISSKNLGDQVQGEIEVKS